MVSSQAMMNLVMKIEPEFRLSKMMSSSIMKTLTMDQVMVLII